jgi:hypothetical protein
MRTMTALMIAMAMSASAWAGDPPAQPTPAAHAAKPPDATGATHATGAVGANWDDSHMQSRYGETQQAARPRISGQTGYAALANRNAEPSASQVRELEFTTQREWEKGELSTNSRARARAAESASMSSGSSRPDRSDGLRGEAYSAGSRH